MNLENRIKKLENVTSVESDIVCFLQFKNGMYEVTVNGQMKSLTEREFKEFQESKNNTKSVFFTGEEALED